MLIKLISGKIKLVTHPLIPRHSTHHPFSCANNACTLSTLSTSNPKLSQLSNLQQVTHCKDSTSWSVKWDHSGKHQIQLLWGVNERVNLEHIPACRMLPVTVSHSLSIINSSLSWILLTTSYFSKMGTFCFYLIKHKSYVIIIM